MLVRTNEFIGQEMAGHRCHDHCAFFAEHIHFKFIYFIIYRKAFPLQVQTNVRMIIYLRCIVNLKKRTFLAVPLERWPAILLAASFFSATDSSFMPRCSDFENCKCFQFLEHQTLAYRTNGELIANIQLA